MRTGVQTTFVQRERSQRSSSQYAMSSRSGAAKNSSLVRGAVTSRVYQRTCASEQYIARAKSRRERGADNRKESDLNANPA